MPATLIGRTYLGQWEHGRGRKSAPFTLAESLKCVRYLADEFVAADAAKLSALSTHLSAKPEFEADCRSLIADSFLNNAPFTHSRMLVCVAFSVWIAASFQVAV